MDALLILLRVVLGIAIAAFVTVVSLRLLGMRRGWLRALISGLIGWGIAGLIALDLAQWHWGAQGLFLHTLVIGIPTTMAVAVILDLLARPVRSRSESTPASSPRRARCAHCGDGSTCCGVIASCCAWPGAKASGR